MKQLKYTFSSVGSHELSVSSDSPEVNKKRLESVGKRMRKEIGRPIPYFITIDPVPPDTQIEDAPSKRFVRVPEFGWNLLAAFVDSLAIIVVTAAAIMDLGLFGSVFGVFSSFYFIMQNGYESLTAFKKGNFREGIGSTLRAGAQVCLGISIFITLGVLPGINAVYLVAAASFAILGTLFQLWGGGDYAASAKSKVTCKPKVWGYKGRNAKVWDKLVREKISILEAQKPWVKRSRVTYFMAQALLLSIGMLSLMLAPVLPWFIGLKIAAIVIFALTAIIVHLVKPKETREHQVWFLNQAHKMLGDKAKVEELRMIFRDAEGPKPGWSVLVQIAKSLCCCWKPAASNPEPSPELAQSSG